MRYPFTSAKQVSPHTSLRTITLTFVASHLMPLLTVPAFQKIAIPESDEDKNCPMFIECKRKYQIVVGSIGWLASSTRPDLAVTHLFLLAHNNKPSQSHWNAALYVLHYIHSTINYGITFTSKDSPALVIRPPSYEPY
jgi:hypothetical protein